METIVERLNRRIDSFTRAIAALEGIRPFMNKDAQAYIDRVMQDIRLNLAIFDGLSDGLAEGTAGRADEMLARLASERWEEGKDVETDFRCLLCGSGVTRRVLRRGKDAMFVDECGACGLGVIGPFASDW